VLGSDATIVLDYIEVLIWPTVVLFALWIFRGKIGDLLDRIRTMKGPLDTSIGLDAPAQQRDPEAVEEAESYVEEHVDELEVEQDVEVEGEDAGRGDDIAHLDVDEVQQLRDQLVFKDMLLDFERIWNAIYGSQVHALRVLRAAPEGAPRQSLEPIFEEAKKRGLPATLAFEDWMQFLLAPTNTTDQGLVFIDAAGNYRLSTRGRAFVGYVDRNRYGNRPW
jgi:hypothetical protein